MTKHLQLLALFCELEHADGTPVIRLQVHIKRVIKEHTRCGADEHMQVISDLFSHFWIHSESVKRQVALDGNDALLNFLDELWSLFEQNLEDVGAKNLILESGNKRLPLLHAH